MSIWRSTGLALTCVCALAAARLLAAEDKKVDLKVGDAVPEFEAKDDQGNAWKSSEHVGKKIIVLYFYPGDFTPGCIAQAQKFRDNMNRISELGAVVIGVSGDSPATHALFKQTYKLNFSLLADEEGSLAKQFGVPVGPGGESPDEVATRMGRFLAQLGGAEGDVLLFGHGHSLRALAAMYLDSPIGLAGRLSLGAGSLSKSRREPLRPSVNSVRPRQRSFPTTTRSRG